MYNKLKIRLMGFIMSNTQNFYNNKKEWSEFKDKLLGSYLKPYFAKILTTQRPVYYIDGFAGKGKFDDGKEGSPLIALNIIELSKSNSKTQNDIFPYFIEFEHARILKENIGAYGNVISGDYKIEVPKILDLIPSNSNVFLYVDPFGFKHLDYAVFEKLKRFKSTELLMNFNSFGFLREGCNLLKNTAKEDEELGDDVDINGKNTIANMNRVAKGTYWQDILDRYYNKEISFEEAEIIFVEEYEKRLNDIFSNVFSIPIITTLRGQPKYRMIYATNYWQGVFLMMDNMVACINEMRMLAQGEQFSIFDYDYTKMNCVKELESLINDDYMDVVSLCFKLYNNYGVKYLTKDIKESLKELERKGVISIKRDPNITLKGKISRSFDFTGKVKLEVKKK